MSEWRNVPAGVPQGTKLGPWLFILMLDDINISNTELWKYVDDTAIAECVDKKEDSRIQSDVKELIAKSNQNKFQLNESKCKEIRISFAKSAADFAPIVINGKAVEVVSTVKLLGLNISSDLRWSCHVAEISKKVASRLYFHKQLKEANIPNQRSANLLLDLYPPSNGIRMPGVSQRASRIFIRRARTATEARHVNYFSVCTV